jgi:pimeloyl-ACP methyl ester carboxylesterase
VGYGYVLIPITNKIAVNSLINTLEPLQEQPDPITVVGYSNGCWTTIQAAEMGYRIDHMVMISPALHSQHAFPTSVKRIDVYYSSNDKAVLAGKWYRLLNRLLPWRWTQPHGWGAMGRTGYQGNDTRVHNHDMGDVGHVWYETERVAEMIANDIDKLYEELDNEKTT